MNALQKHYHYVAHIDFQCAKIMHFVEMAPYKTRENVVIIFVFGQWGIFLHFVNRKMMEILGSVISAILSKTVQELGYHLLRNPYPIRKNHHL